jgi:hypothetical protein
MEWEEEQQRSQYLKAMEEAEEFEKETVREIC